MVYLLLLVLPGLLRAEPGRDAHHAKDHYDRQDYQHPDLPEPALLQFLRRAKRGWGAHQPLSSISSALSIIRSSSALFPHPMK